MMSSFLYQAECYFWPGLTIMKPGREDVAAEVLLRMLEEYLRSFRFGAEDHVLPEALKGRATVEETVRWLDGIWALFHQSVTMDRHRLRHSLVRQIADSRLSPEEQSNLLAAVDYLSRLAAAHGLAAKERGSAVPGMPATFNRSMQSAYHTLAGLSAADLPIWLVGETGTELESWPG